MARAYFRPKKGFTGKRKEAPRNGTWWIDFAGADGARRQERTPARTETEAERYAQEASQRAYGVRTGVTSALPSEFLTFTEAARRYRATVSHLVSYPQIEVYLSKHLEPNIGRKLLQEITPADVDALAAKLMKRLSPGTVQQALIRVSAVYTWARRSRIYRGENPVSEAAKVDVPTRAPRALTAPQLQALLDAAGPWRLVFLVAAWCGLRKGEVSGLLWEDVDLEAELLHVRRSYDRATTKGRKERVVPLPSWLAEELRQARTEARSPLVFPNRDGRMRTHGNFRAHDSFRRALVRANLVKGWRLACGCGHVEETPVKAARPCAHCGASVLPRGIPLDMTFRHLRSTCATLLGDLRLAQVMLGHSSPQVTARHYHAAELAALRRAVEALPRARDTDGTPPGGTPPARLAVTRNRL